LSGFDLPEGWYMIVRLSSLFNFLFGSDAHERLKLLFLSILFFLIIGGYTVIRTLKDSLFTAIVGNQYMPLAKIWSIVILIPAILIFSKLVDVLRKYHLLYVYSALYGLGCLAIVYCIGHPTIGLANTMPGKYRVFGWVVYFFLEGINPFLVSLAWSFAHSIHSPEEAKVNYPMMVAASKAGGMLTAGLSCWLLARTALHTDLLQADIINHQILLGVAAGLLLLAPLVLYVFVHKVPNKFMHGYEAAYKEERQHDAAQRKGISAFFKELFAGITLLFRYPYTLGIFGVMAFWEIINVFLNLTRIGVAQKAAVSLSGQTCILLHQDFWVHAIGILITVLGTRTFLNLLGERISLLVVPFVIGGLLICYFSVQSAAALSFVFVLTRSINYAFAYPLRESLYIPTSKDIKFKSKTWIEAFGVKIAKAVGSSLVFAAGFGVFSVIIGLWVITAHLLGRRFEKAIRNNEVIGQN
jgi:AAA family ATP:ADP antiporter